MASPGGFPFCLVDHPASVRSPAATWPGGHRSQVDQVCLDIPPSRFAAECRFWADLSGRELAPTGSEEFLQVPRTPEEPVRILLQRLEDEQERVTAHLDLACDDRPAETERHLALGAVLERRFEHFTVLQDPTGMRYCITDRHPVG